MICGVSLIEKMKYISYSILVILHFASLFILYYKVFLNPSFLKNNLKKIKHFSKRPKGLKLTSSPYWKALELFVGVRFLKNYETPIN